MGVVLASDMGGARSQEVGREVKMEQSRMTNSEPAKRRPRLPNTEDFSVNKSVLDPTRHVAKFSAL